MAKPVRDVDGRLIRLHRRVDTYIRTVYISTVFGRRVDPPIEKQKRYREPRWHLVDERYRCVKGCGNGGQAACGFVRRRDGLAALERIRTVVEAARTGAYL